MLKEVKEIMDKELKEQRTAMFHQIENIRRDRKYMKKPNRNSGAKSIITEMKNLLEEFSNSSEHTEERINELKTGQFKLSSWRSKKKIE